MTHEERKRRRLEIVQAAKDGESNASIAERFGLSEPYVMRIAKQYGVNSAARRRAEIVRMSREGISAEEIAEKCYVSTGSVARAIRALGIKAQRPTMVRITTMKILKELLDGKPQVDIAREFGVSKQRIWTISEQAKSCGFQFPETTCRHPRARET